MTYAGRNEPVDGSKVSIIIPTFNAGETITRCLRSIRNQSYPRVEVIVVDNFSNDTTIDVARAFGAKVLQQKSNPASARNTGIVNSEGKYVFFVDSDQVLSRGVVEECVTECEVENAGMVRVPELFIGEGFWGSCSAEWKNYYGKVERRYRAHGKILSGEPRFFVKEQLIRVGMFDASLLWGEDYDLYQRLKERNVKEVSCQSILYHIEPASVKRIVTRNLRYGESMPTFMHHSDKQVFSRVVRHSLLAWGESLSELPEKPDIAFGCTVLLGMKAFAMIAGLLANLA
ncbi:MAG TPA: glycosyltransferase family 2 protein [candidate division Zixibacteria bacterium]|nr:glycosyltransferase family 2 protein [candidate division Zixibacteria bacterium]